MAGEEIKLNTKADRLTMPELFPGHFPEQDYRTERNPFLGDTQRLSFKDPGLESYTRGNPVVAYALAVERGDYALKDPTRQKSEPTIFASDKKSSDTKVTLGGTKKKDGDEKKAEGKDGKQVAEKEKPEESKEPDFFAQLTNNPMTQALLGDAMSVEISSEIPRLEVPTTPKFGTAFADARPGQSKSSDNFFKQFDKKPSNKIG